MTKPVVIRVGKDAARRVLRGSPWIEEHAIEEQSRPGSAGEVAVVYGPRREQVAVGLLDPGSPMRVRVLHRGGAKTVDAAMLCERVEGAIARRSELANSGTNGYRVVHGDNDGMPGLIVDRYASTLVIKLYSVAWVPHLQTVLSPLVAALAPDRVVLRLARLVAEQREHLGELGDGMLLMGTDSGTSTFVENGLTFEVDPFRGQKTGFFLDQRDNRQLVGERARGLEVLNVFSYTGGFSLYAARAGAKRVVSVDASAPALKAAERNFELNRALVGGARHEVVCDDAFAALGRMASEGRRFGMVIIDPPSFAKKHSEIERALDSYARLCRLGLGVLSKGGWLVLASCSSRVSREAFEASITRAARDAGRPLKVELWTEHAPDHPIAHRRGGYLKCVFARA